MKFSSSSTPVFFREFLFSAVRPYAFFGGQRRVLAAQRGSQPVVSEYAVWPVGTVVFYYDGGEVVGLTYD